VVTRDALAKLPYWAALQPARRKKLLAALEERSPKESFHGLMPPGPHRHAERLKHGVLPDFHLALLEGHALLFRDGRPERRMGPGDHAITREGDTLLELTSIRYLRGPVLQETVTDRRALAAYTRAEIDRVTAQRIELEEGMTQFMDWETGELPESTHEVEGTMRMFLVQDPSLRHVLPRPLFAPFLDDRYLLIFADFPDVKGTVAGKEVSLSYHETTFFRPCIHPTMGPGLYSPELYPDEMMAVVVGRELYGFPKRYAQTELGEGFAAWILDRELAALGRWFGEEPIEDFYATVAEATLGKGNLEAGAARDAVERFGDEFARMFVERVPLPIFVRRKTADEATGSRNDDLIAIPFYLDNIRDERQLVNPMLMLELPRLKWGTTKPQVDLAWTLTGDMRMGEATLAADIAPGMFRRSRLLASLARAGTGRLMRLAKGLVSG